MDGESPVHHDLKVNTGVRYIFQGSSLTLGVESVAPTLAGGTSTTEQQAGRGRVKFPLQFYEAELAEIKMLC